MNLLCHDKTEAYTALQALKSPGQCAWLQESRRTGETIIRICHVLSFNAHGEEITSAEQLKNEKYKIIA